MKRGEQLHKTLDHIEQSTKSLRMHARFDNTRDSWAIDQAAINRRRKAFEEYIMAPSGEDLPGFDVDDDGEYVTNSVPFEPPLDENMAAKVLEAFGYSPVKVFMRDTR